MSLSITILNTTVSRDTELIGKMDLFVVGKLSGTGLKPQEFKTRVVKGGKGQLTTFNQNFTLHVPASSSDARLLFEVKDEDVTTDDMVGIAWMNLRNCNALNRGQNQYEVRLHYKNQDAGVLNIMTSYQ